MVKLPSPEALRFDRRTLDRYKSAGKLKDKEFADHLKSLPDESANLEKTVVWDENAMLPSQKLRLQAQQAKAQGRKLEEETTEETSEEEETFGLHSSDSV